MKKKPMFEQTVKIFRKIKYGLFNSYNKYVWLLSSMGRKICYNAESERSELYIITIAYNHERLIEKQIEMVRRYVKDEKFQHIINDFYEIEQVTPSLAQAIKMKKMDKENNLDEEDIENILSEEKANQKKSSINLSQDFCTRYFPKCHTRSEVEGEILKLIRKLESYEAVKADTRGKEEMAV